MPRVSRRRFLQISAATFGGAAAATAIRPLVPFAQAAGGPGEVTTTATFCEMCFWRCGGFATVRDGKLWKFEGNPKDPAEQAAGSARAAPAPWARSPTRTGCASR